MDGVLITNFGSRLRVNDAHIFPYLGMETDDCIQTANHGVCKTVRHFPLWSKDTHRRYASVASAT